MPSAYKRAGRATYSIEYKDQHGRVRKNVGTDIKDKRVAKALAEKIEGDAARLRAGLPPEYPDLTGPYLGLGRAADVRGLDEAVADYLADLERRGKRPATLRHRRYKLGLLARECGWRTLADVGADGLRRFLTRSADAGRAQSTTNAYRDTAYAFLAWCADQGWVDGNAAARVKRGEGSAPRPYLRRPFTPDELRALLAASARHRDRYLVAALTGLRGRELSLVEKRDFDLTTGVWTCREEVDKEGRAWRLPVLPDLRPDLARIVLALPAPSSRLFPVRVRSDTLDNHLARAGLAKVDDAGRRLNFHSLRYTFCVLCARAMPIQTVQRLMRHADIRYTVNLYLQLGLDDLAAAVEALPPLFDAAALPTTFPTGPRDDKRKAN